MKIKDAFTNYLDLGYQPILLHPNTKMPIFYGWQKKYNYQSYYELLDSNKKYNIGFLLGNIVDVEGDTNDANQILNNYFLAINHPIYKSKKSYHHLFKNSYRNITRIQIQGFEIRGYNHQSVVPPSNVDSVEDYIWLENLIPFKDLPEIPHDFAKSFNIKSFKSKEKKSKDKNKSAIWCFKCRNKFYLNRSFLTCQLNKLKEKKENWFCKICKK